MSQFLNASYVTPVTIRDMKRRTTNETLSQRVRGAESVSQYWGLTISLAPDNGQTNLGGCVAAHQAEHGLLRPFDIPMPQHVGVGENPDPNSKQPDGSSSAVQLGGASVGANSFVTFLGPGAQEFTVRAGQFFRFSNHNKIYMLLEDFNFTRRQGTFRFYPNLVEDLQVEFINFAPNIRVLYESTSLDGIVYTRGIITQVRLSVREML